MPKQHTSQIADDLQDISWHLRDAKHSDAISAWARAWLTQGWELVRAIEKEDAKNDRLE